MVVKMKLKEILSLKSSDYIGMTVSEILPQVVLDDYHKEVRQLMQQDGINKAPVMISGGYLRNGHHRVKMAAELNLPAMLVTDDYGEHDRSSPEKKIV